MVKQAPAPECRRLGLFSIVALVAFLAFPLMAVPPVTHKAVELRSTPERQVSRTVERPAPPLTPPLPRLPQPAVVKRDPLVAKAGRAFIKALLAPLRWWARCCGASSARRAASKTKICDLPAAAASLPPVSLYPLVSLLAASRPPSTPPTSARRRRRCGAVLGRPVGGVFRGAARARTPPPRFLAWWSATLPKLNPPCAGSLRRTDGARGSSGYVGLPLRFEPLGSPQAVWRAAPDQPVLGQQYQCRSRPAASCPAPASMRRWRRRPCAWPGTCGRPRRAPRAAPRSTLQAISGAPGAENPAGATQHRGAGALPPERRGRRSAGTARRGRDAAGGEKKLTNTSRS